MERILTKVRNAVDVLMLARKLPVVEIDLMYSKTKANQKFFQRITLEFFEESQKRHSRFPLWRRNSMGMAIYEIKGGHDAYLGAIESSGRRNIKKAQRLRYNFEKIEFNMRLAEISKIRSSTNFRQGEMPSDMKQGIVARCDDPPSLSSFHDYPYYGVLLDGKLYAYAGCFIAGEVCLIQHILGHAEKLGDGVVPLLLSEIVREVCQNHKAVRFVAYGTYFGASKSMQRFKKKFGLLPAKVHWHLDKVR